jgi:DNA polymerase I-like protein with 3'-5' exonuclease and polymerase domains
MLTSSTTTAPPLQGASRFRRIASRFIVPTTTKVSGAVFDVETDGFLHDATKVHCVVIVDLGSDKIAEYSPKQITKALAHLSRLDYLVAHNGSGFDIPVLRRLHNWQPGANCRIADTLVASRLILPNLEDIDDQAAAMGDPKLGRLRGRYSIEAWGARLQIPKVGADIEDFSKWTPELQARCVADTLICKALWQFLQPDGYSQKAMELEYRAAEVCAQITAAGVPFDVNAAEQQYQQWSARHAEIGDRLNQQFPGVNLNSRKQLGELLEAKGWVPAQRTEKTNQPKIDDETLEGLPALYPEFAGLSEFMILGRRIAQLRTGKQAWCHHVDKNGRIHGGLLHIGTPHSRASHLTPNLAQVPNPKRAKPYAAECRSLFRTSNDWVFVCCDQAGLQDRCFAHYLSGFDGGEYAKAFANGLDPHWKCSLDLGLVAPGAERDKQNKVHVAIREGAKSFRYAFLYGAGSPQAGRIVGNIIRTVQQIDPGNGLHHQFFGAAARPSAPKLKQIGADAIKKFIDGTPGLGRLRTRLEEGARRMGWLPGLDGRRVPVRALYTVLNFLVTSSEAIICKRWLCNVFDELNQRFRYGWDGDCVIVLWVHDEIAVCCRPEIADQVGEIMVRHAKEAGEFYKFKVPLEAAYQIGKSWAGDIAAPDPATESAPWTGKPDFPEPDPEASTEPGADDVDDIVIEDMRHIDINAIRSKPTSTGDDRDDYSYPHGEQRTGKRAAIFLYRDHLSAPHTRVEKHVQRDGGRSQYPQSFYVNGAWVRKKPAGWSKVPYRLPEMLAELAKNPKTDVFIPEGEKDAETLAALGLIATTSSEGATNPKSKKGSNWTAELNKWFAGVQRAFILEDNDEPGRNFAREKARALAGIVPDIRVVSFPDVPETEDVSYWLEHGHTKDELLARCESEPSVNDAQNLETERTEAVKIETIDWLWPGRFALGKLGILAGLPDEGKSALLCYIASRLTNPKLTWPNDEGCATKHGTVLMLACEDGIADTLVPRLKAADADLSRVQIIKMVHDRDANGRERQRMFSFVDDLGRLRRLIEKIGDVVALEIDPVTAYLGTSSNGGVDSFRDTDVRAVLSPLIQLAEDCRITIFAVMHFNKKIDVTNALLRISNSLAFGGVARHVFAVTRDAANSRRLMSRAKNNVASEETDRTLAFHFETKIVGEDWRNGRPIEAPYVEFEPGYVDVTATEALSAVSESKSPSAIDNAKDFLREMLVAGGGRALKTEIEEAAEAEKISDATLRRAKDRLKIRAEKDRSDPKGKWYWILPEDAAGEL